MEEVKRFTTSGQQVFLLLGDSGAGKSTFNRELECELWHSYKKKTGVIPLFINLPAIDRPEYDMIAKQLRKAEFTEPQIRELKLYRKFVLICDGYDEGQQTHNLYTSNRLNEAGEWKAKMVVSCRSEYLGVDYRDRFQPGDRNHRSDAALFQEAVITSFSMDQVHDYIEQYVSVHRPLWGAKDYSEVLNRIPSLKELVKNPFLMSLSLEVLPRMVDPEHDFSVTRSTHITRVALYDQFIEHWLERGRKRLGEKNLSPQSRAAFESLSDEGFTQNGISFFKKLCWAIFKEQGGQPIVQYSRCNDEESWKSAFFSRDEEKQLLREACPLTRNGNQHRFIHRSLLEYGLALAIFDPHDLKGIMVPKSLLARRGSTCSDDSFIMRDNVESMTVSAGLQPDFNSPLVWRSFVNEPSILQFLGERVQQEPAFKQLLLDYVDLSRLDSIWRTAAANAITTLVRAGVQFNGANLLGIRIPGADLSYGVFEAAQLQASDLRHVNFRGAWLPRADLSGAWMKGVQFGELPFLKHVNGTTFMSYSPDGKSFALGLSGSQFTVYSTSNWERLWTSDGYSSSSLSYSPKGDQIASCAGKAIQLWDVEAGQCLHTFTGHDSDVACVVYSPQGDRIASGGRDHTVRIWDVRTRKCIRRLEGHTGGIDQILHSPIWNCIASRHDRTIWLWDVEGGVCSHTLSGHSDRITHMEYSTQGDRLASASKDKTLRLWDADTGTCLHTLVGHSDAVLFVTYSPDGTQLASGSSDKTLKLWDVVTGTCLHNLIGHRGEVKTVAYSPRGDLFASASSDRTVKLWDVESGECRLTLYGHSRSVRGAIFSPKGDQVASRGDDGIVRLWDMELGSSLQLFNGHRGTIRGVKCSPNGRQVASCSSDGTIRPWDVETGECYHAFNGHDGEINCIAYAPQGGQVASAGGDSTVRLWDVATGECTGTLIGHTKEVLCVVYSPKGNQLASYSEDNTIRLWVIETGFCDHTLRGHRDGISSTVFLPQGNRLVSSSWDGTLRLWDVGTGECLRVLAGNNSRTIIYAAYSPDGNQVATISQDNTVRLWDIAAETCLCNLTEHDDVVGDVAFSPRGNQLASASNDGTVRLWNLETGACTHILSGHTDRVTRVVYSPQGELLASSSEDMTVRLWDAMSGQCRAEVEVHQIISDIAWSTILESHHLITGCEDGSLGSWQVTHHEERLDVNLRWRTTNGELFVTDTIIQDVRGLNQLNTKLLKQRHAYGEPLDRLHDTGKKVATIASVISKLKPLINNSAESSSSVDNTTVEHTVEQLELQAGPAKDSVVIES